MQRKKDFKITLKIVILLLITIISTSVYSQNNKYSYLTTAVLDIKNTDVTALKNIDLSALLSAKLSEYNNLRIVERNRLEDIMKELKLSSIKTISSKDKQRIGRLTGAHILITGGIFKLGDKIFFNTQITNVETSELKGVSITFDNANKIYDILNKLSEKIYNKIWTEKEQTFQKSKEEIKIEVLLDKIEIPKPGLTVLVIIPEHDISGQMQSSVCEIELIRLLTKYNFNVVSKSKYIDILNTYIVNKDSVLKKLKDQGIDLFLKGEAFSSYGGNIEGLISSTAQAELTAVLTSDASIVFSGSVETVGVDISEAQSVHKALKKAGESLCYKFLQETNSDWNNILVKVSKRIKKLGGEPDRILKQRRYILEYKKMQARKRSLIILFIGFLFFVFLSPVFWFSKINSRFASKTYTEKVYIYLLFLMKVFKAK